MEQNKNDSSFIFLVDGSGIPKVNINGDKVAIVKVEYYWTTATERRGCISNANVSGYINGENKLRMFRINFVTNEVNEVNEVFNGGN